MGLFDTLRNIGRAQVDSVNDALADPARDGKYDIADAKAEIDTITKQIVELSSQNKRNLAQQQEAQESANRYQNAAQAAAAKGIADDVRKLLTQKKTFADQAASFQSDIDKNTKLINDMRSRRDAATAKISAAESGLARIKAAQANNQIRQSLSQQATTFGGGNSALSRLDKITDAASKSDSDTEAWEDEAKVQDNASGKDLLDKYGGGDGVDAEVAALMASAQQGALPAPAVQHALPAPGGSAA